MNNAMEFLGLDPIIFLPNNEDDKHHSVSSK